MGDRCSGRGRLRKRDQRQRRHRLTTVNSAAGLELGLVSTVLEEGQELLAHGFRRGYEQPRRRVTSDTCWCRHPHQSEHVQATAPTCRRQGQRAATGCFAPVFRESEPAALIQARSARPDPALVHPHHTKTRDGTNGTTHQAAGAPFFQAVTQTRTQRKRLCLPEAQNKEQKKHGAPKIDPTSERPEAAHTWHADFLQPL